MSLLIEKLKQNPWLIAGLIVILFCGGFTWLRSAQLSQLTAREESLVHQLETIRENVKRSKNIEQDIQNLEARLASIKEQLFNREERATNINFFYTFEEKLDVLISEVEQLDEKSLRFSQNGPDELKLYSVINYNVTLSGTFREILKFLYEIHQAEPIMRVTDFQINTTNDTDNQPGKLTAEVRVAVLAKKINQTNQ